MSDPETAQGGSHHESSTFDFEEGDEVLVRVRDCGRIVAKFEAECVDISGRPGPSSEIARFSVPWGQMESTKLRPFEAQFEVID